MNREMAPRTPRRQTLDGYDPERFPTALSVLGQPGRSLHCPLCGNMHWATTNLAREHVNIALRRGLPATQPSREGDN